MSTNAIFGFVVGVAVGVGGVAVGVGGTLLIDYIANKQSEEEVWPDDVQDEAVYVNPPDRTIKNEKPEIEDVVEQYHYNEIAEKYQSSETEEPPREDKEPTNIFDVAERADEEFEKKDAVPPQFRDKPIVNPCDIQEISAKQFREEATDYSKQSVCYFIDDDILTNDDTMEVIDVESSVGEDTIKRMVDEEIFAMFVSNLTTEIDYEIVVDEENRYADVLEQYHKNATLERYEHNVGDGDEECLDETS